MGGFYLERGAGTHAGERLSRERGPAGKQSG